MHEIVDRAAVLVRVPPLLRGPHVELLHGGQERALRPDGFAGADHSATHGRGHEQRRRPAERSGLALRQPRALAAQLGEGQVAAHGFHQQREATARVQVPGVAKRGESGVYGRLVEGLLEKEVFLPQRNGCNRARARGWRVHRRRCGTAELHVASLDGPEHGARSQGDLRAVGARPPVHAAQSQQRGRVGREGVGQLRANLSQQRVQVRPADLSLGIEGCEDVRAVPVAGLVLGKGLGDLRGQGPQQAHATVMVPPLVFHGRNGTEQVPQRGHRDLCASRDRQQSAPRVLLARIGMDGQQRAGSHGGGRRKDEASEQGALRILRGLPAVRADDLPAQLLKQGRASITGAIQHSFGVLGDGVQPL
mmetsp:Transcript_47546/g.149406  ORF Transcript_47546/g.149406 Transcript_47546/m.149406 type:complete len:364 (-) Transcript_47546:468-1559(-)